MALPIALLWHAAAVQGQDLVVSRNQFVDEPQRPEVALAGTAPVVLRDERRLVSGAATLRIVSPDPQVAVVLRLRPIEPPAAGSASAGPVESAGPAAPAVPGQPQAAPLRLYAIVIAEEGARRYEYKAEGELLRGGALVAQQFFRVGDRGLETALSGAPGRVQEIVIQDDGDAELRLRQVGEVLELQVVPPAAGGAPSAEQRSRVLSRPLRFVDATLIGTGYKDNALGELWLGHRFAARVDGFFPKSGSAVLVRGLVTAQAWRSDRFSLWAEGGGGWYRLQDKATGTTTDALHFAGGVTLHWRYADWGAAAHVGLVGEKSVLALYGGWQVWRSVAFVLSWHTFESRSGFGLGAALDF